MRAAVLTTAFVIAALALYANQRAAHQSESLGAPQAELADEAAPFVDALPDVAAGPVPDARPAPEAAASQGGETTYHTAASAPPSPERRHVVREGESLASIARDYYGDDERAQAIYAANRDQIRDPEHLRPGQTLILP